MKKAAVWICFGLVAVMGFLGVAAVRIVLDTAEKVGKAACVATGQADCIVDLATAIATAWQQAFTMSGSAAIAPCTAVSATKSLNGRTVPADASTGQAINVLTSGKPRLTLTLVEKYGYATNFGADPNHPGEFGKLGGRPNTGNYFASVSPEQFQNDAFSVTAMAAAILPSMQDVDEELWKSNPGRAATIILNNVFDTEDPSEAAQADIYQRSVAFMQANGWSTDFAGDVAAERSSDTQFQQHLFVGVADAATAQAIAAKYPDIGGWFFVNGDGGRVSSELLSSVGSIRDAMHTPAYFAVDEEYTGEVDALGLNAGKKASDLAAMPSDQVTAEGQRIGAALAEAGINMDFAPSVDLQIPSNAVIGAYDRGISQDPAVITAKAGALIAGMASKGVIATIKHWPGHGQSSGDSHTTLPTTPDWEALQATDVVPFKNLAINSKMSVMVGHLNVPGLTDGQPASQSPAAYEALRNLGFRGMVVTDELGGMVGAGNGSLGEKIAGSINAGADMALFNVASLDDFERAYNKAKGLTSNFNDSHIIQSKYQYGLPVGANAPPDSTGSTELANQSIGTVQGNLDGNKVPEPMRSIMIRAAEANDIDPSFIAALYLTENNGFPFALAEFDGKGKAAYNLTKDSPEWHAEAYGVNGVFAPSNGTFQGPFQFDPRSGRSWSSYGRDGDGDGSVSIYSFADAAFAAGAYLKALGAQKGDVQSFYTAARQYNGQVSWSGIQYPKTDASRFPKVQDFYAYQASELSKALGGGDTSGQAAINACNSQTSANVLQSSGPTGDAQRDAVKNAALKWLGTRYSWGGGDLHGPTVGTTYGCTRACYDNNDPTTPGLDCSGFTRLAIYQGIGYEIPRTSGEQYDATRGEFARDETTAKPYDLIFWSGHVAFWVGDGTILEAPQSGSVVKISPVRKNPRGLGDPYALAASGR